MKDQATILAVDDSPESLALLAKLLTLAGYRVHPAGSGELALAAVAADPPDLILLDVRMPGVNGLEVCRRLKAREETRRIPIILISASAGAKESVEGLQLGAADYITKPFQTGELLARVKTHLALSRAYVSLEQQAAALHQTNEQLQAEIVERRRVEGELRQSLDRAERSRRTMLSALEDQKQAEAARRESEERYRAMMEQAADAVFMHDETGRILDVNRQACQNLGYSREELLSKSIGDIDPEAIQTGKAELWAKVLAGEQFTFESRQLRKDGSSIPVEVALASMRLPLGSAVLGIVRDITERKQAENMIEARLRLIEFAAKHSLNELLQKTLDEVCDMTGSPIGFYHFVEPDQKTLSLQAWSTRTLQEYCKAESKGLHYGLDQAGVWVDCVRQRQPVIHNDYASLAQRKGLPAGHAELVRELTVPIQRDGLIVAVLGVGNKTQPYTEKDTDLVAYFADVAWEIAQRKQAEEELLQQRNLLNTIVESASEAIFAKDTAGQYHTINEAGARMLGYRAVDVIGRTDMELLPAETAGEFRKTDEYVMSSGQVYEREETGVIGGATFTFLAHKTPWRDNSGKIMGVIGISNDITTRKQAEAEIQKLNTELEQRVRDRTAQLETTNQELEAFAYSVSHDLRAPLRGIDGWSHALLEDYTDRLDDQGRQYIDRVRAETQRMGRLIDDLLKLSRVTRAEMRQEHVNLSVLAQAIVTRLQESEPERRVEFSLQPGLTAVGDPDLLEAALSNLLDNAFKFTGQRAVTRIEFGQTETPGRCAFFVRDNGAGFDMAYSQKLFGAFQRLHRTSDFPGTGIGLATAQRIIHRHGGRVWAEAAVDQGATFYFTLEEA